MNIPSNIALVGFMGSGKSSVAKQLSAKLGKILLDCDSKIVELIGYPSVGDIFAQQGETYFREQEIALCKSLINAQNTVISSGGGMVMNKINIDYLKMSSTVVYLHTDFATIANRLKGDTTRPLMADKAKAEALYNLRLPLYKAYADIEIATKGMNLEQVVDAVLDKLST